MIAKEPPMIDPGLVFENLLFATPFDRCRYIGTLVRDRPQWLKDHPGAWRPLEDVLREAAAWKRRVEGPVETIATGPSSQIPSDIRKDDENVDGAASVEIPPGDPSSPHPPTLTKKASKTPPPPSRSDFEDEIAIGPRRYVSADRLAAMWDISRRQLSRRIKAGKVPPMIKIGKKLYFEVGAISEGPASDGSEQARPSNNEAC
jgi:hypothetical protein